MSINFYSHSVPFTLTIYSMKPYATAEVGEVVTPSAQTIHNYFNIAEMIVREEADIRKVARELHEMQQSKLRRTGISG